MMNGHVKTPKKPGKRSRRFKADDDSQILEFMSYESFDHFSNLEADVDDESSVLSSQLKTGTNLEYQIEEWLSAKNICRSLVSDKKAIFFDEKRDRVCSLSFFDYLAETDVTSFSPKSQMIDTICSEFSPHKSKLSKKRSGFASYGNLDKDSNSKIPLRYTFSEQESSSDKKTNTFTDIVEEDFSSDNLNFEYCQQSSGKSIAH